MPWPVYSERFVADSVGDGWFSYVVPDGRRAVLRHIALANPSEAASYVHVQVGGIRVYFRHVQASDPGFQISGMWVAYTHELVEFYKTGTNMSVGLYGYLFDDPGGASGPPLEDVPGQLPERPPPPGAPG